MISHETHLFSDHPKVPGRLQSAVCHHPQILSWQSHPKHEGTKVLLPQWTKLRINFSSESWTDSKYLSRTGLESLIQTSCGSGRKSLANTDPIAKFQQRWTLSGEKCIQSSTLEKFTKFHIKVIPVCGFQQSPCRKTHQSSRVESSQRQGHSKVETKCSGGVTQSYSLKVTRFK